MPEKFELDEKNTMLILSYLWVLALIPRFTKKDDVEILWHSKNGLGLFIVELAICFLTFPFFVISGFIFHSFWFFFAFFYFFFSFLILLLHIFCILKAIKGEKLEIPYLSFYAQKL